MNSRVTVRDEATGKTQLYTLVYPGGAATWVARDGQTETLTAVGILYQPEANGRFDL
jgi:transcription elongation GreA/GreB family factor